MQRSLVAALLAHGFIELELHDETCKIANVGHVGCNVVLGPGVKVWLRSLHRRFDALHGFPQAPPFLVVVLLRDAAVKDPPSPRIDEQAEGQEGNFKEGHVHQVVDFRLWIGNKTFVRNNWPSEFIPNTPNAFDHRYLILYRSSWKPWCRKSTAVKFLLQLFDWAICHMINLGQLKCVDESANQTRQFVKSLFCSCILIRDLEKTLWNIISFLYHVHCRYILNMEKRIPKREQLDQNKNLFRNRQIWKCCISESLLYTSTENILLRSLQKGWIRRCRKLLQLVLHVCL